MNQETLNNRRDVAIQHLKPSGLPFKVYTPVGSKLTGLHLIIDAGAHEIVFIIKTNKWSTKGKRVHMKKRSGTSIYSAIECAKALRAANKPKAIAAKIEKNREKKYNKQTPANLLFKLTQAVKFFKEGNSMSKAARMAKVEYRAVKEHVAKLPKGL